MKEKCPVLGKLEWYDCSLNRKVHLYEHVILMAHGLIRPSFVHFLSLRSKVDEATLKEMKLRKKQLPEFNALQSIVSLYQGEFDEFEMNGEGFFDALELYGVKGTSQSSKL